MSLKNKLNRLKPHLSVGKQTEQQGILSNSTKTQVPFLERWEAEGVFPYFLEEDYCLIREVVYPLTEKHGHYEFRDFLTAVNIWNNEPISHPISSSGYRANDLFFFDTETTGLGGGTGNTIFLLGYASIKEEQLILRQHILPHPGAEVPLYKSFLEKVDYKALVTYNGKSFDWPQVKTRHTLVRDHVPKLPDFGHFDLFHAARRLWKHKLDRMKLSIVEKEILGVDRVDDIPGFLAPMIYFDFIESKQPDGMLGILKHNEMDILSLVTLYTHLTFQIYGTDQNRTRPETFEVGRWFSTLGETKVAEKTLMELVNEDDGTSFQAKFILANQYKKAKDWEKARGLFSEVAESKDERMVLEALIELSMIYEHRLINIPLALNYCEQAMGIAVKMKVLHKKMSIDRIQTRLNRLKVKSAKFPG